VKEKAVLKFGQKYLNLACILEGIAGGDGPYGDQKIFFDSWARKKIELPGFYSDGIPSIIRRYAKEIGNTEDEDAKERSRICLEMFRKAFLTFAIGLRNVRSQLRELDVIAYRIKDPVRSQTRIDQVRGMNIFLDVLYSDLYPNKGCPVYQEIVEYMTGVSPAMIPSREEIDMKRYGISELLSRKGYGSSEFMSQIAAWRNDLRLLRKEEMLDMYRQGVEKLVDSIKISSGFPADAKVKVVEPSKTGSDRFRSGSFDYGRGGPYRAESRIIPDDTSTLVDVATTVAHEIGGHYMLSVLWDKYHRQTGDLFGAIGTMCSNIAITQEGIASHGTRFYEKELANIYGDNIMKDIGIAQELEELAMMMLPFEIARKENEQTTPEKMVEEFIEYGVSEGRAERRTVGIFDPFRRPRTLAYTGSAYMQGSQYIGRLIERYGAKRVLEACVEPISLLALSKSLGKVQ